jgi:hypothetical protein
MSVTEDQQRKLVAELRLLLPELFDQEEVARALLADIGRVRSRQSEWRSSVAFWEAELRSLQLGTIRDGIPALVVAAAARFPGNDVLAALAELVVPDFQASAPQPEEKKEESDRAARKPDLPEARLVEPSRQFHTLTLIGSERHDDFLRLVQRLVDADAQLCYATTSQSAVLIEDPGPRAAHLEEQLLAEVRDWGETVAVEYQASEVRPYLLRRIVVSSADNRRFELRNVPSTTTPSEIARAVLQYNTDDSTHARRGRVRTAIDRVDAAGRADRLDPSGTLSAAGVQDGDELRLATEATAGGGTALWRESELGLPPQRFLVAQMPTRVPLSADVSLLVRVSADQATVPAAGSALLQGLEIGSGGAQVTVVVQAPLVLTPLTALEQVIFVPAQGDSSPVRFAFQARGAGLHRIIVTAWAGGTFLAELGLELSVEQAGSYVDGPARTAPVNSVQAEPGEVTLQVRFDGQRYIFQLLSQSYLFEPVLAEALTAHPSQAVERTIATLRAMASGTGRYSGRNARTWMEQAGVGLWNDMVPELIRDQFWLLNSNITAFSIAAADDIIPWELLYPLAQGRDEGFLVEQFPVMRRVYGQQRIRRFTADGIKYVVPSGSPVNAGDEITAIRRVLREADTSTDAIGDLDVLLDLIESGHCGLLHFACHNTFTADAGGSAIAMGGGPFVPMLLNKAIMRHTLAERHPLVFINACRSAGAVPEYTRMMGWAQGFMAAGAGAFAGTLWAVRSESAATFAKTFYAALTAGSALGEACRQARAETGRDHDDPTWLAYSVYGDPAAEAILTSQA